MEICGLVIEKCMPIKSPILYKPCKNCTELFPYKESAKVRGSYSVDLKRIVGSIKTKFCSNNCKIFYLNIRNNPAKKSEVRKKMSENAKKRGVSHMNTIEARKKLSQSITGKNHWNWKGGITSINRLRRNCKEYKLWRKSVFKRDNYTCQECFLRSGNGKSVVLNAHHIKPFSLFPELRLDLSNGVTLCLDCHKKTDTYMGRIKNYIINKSNIKSPP
jgi:uncharacterized protein YlzI (FlbEa/FlbD family)